MGSYSCVAVATQDAAGENGMTAGGAEAGWLDLEWRTPWNVLTDARNRHRAVGNCLSHPIYSAPRRHR